VAKPEIFNTDQGSQFTSNAFTGRSWLLCGTLTPTITVPGT